ncbi:MAG: hypothetical protein AABX44_01805 [Nanoarchaeota archaeon]
MAKKEAKKTSGSGVIISIIIITAIVLIILGASLLSKKNTQDETSGENLSPSEEVVSEILGPVEHIVEITLEGFVPRTLKIKKGDKVTWINKIVTKVRPAGDVHPTHTSYPGSSVIKCGTVAEKEAFDACRELQYGESYSFVFNEVGSWGYHNHLQPSKDGKIVVS